MKDEQGFRKYLAESLEEFENPAVYDSFIEKHRFESDISNYCDSHSLFGLDDQDDLEELIKVFMY